MQVRTWVLACSVGGGVGFSPPSWRPPPVLVDMGTGQPLPPPPAPFGAVVVVVGGHMVVLWLWWVGGWVGGWMPFGDS